MSVYVLENELGDRMTELAGNGSSTRATRVKRTGQATHGLIKGLVIIGVPSGISLMLFIQAMSDPSMGASAALFGWTAIMLVAALPILIFGPYYLITGALAALDNIEGKNRLPNRTHIFRSTNGREVYGDANAKKVAFAGRVYDFDDVSDVSYLGQRVTIQMREGPKAVEIIVVGKREACELYMRNFLKMLDLSAASLREQAA